jgi:hypothetical protein
MCTAAINLTSRALGDVTNAEVLLKIKGFISLFIQTMEVSIMSHVSTSLSILSYTSQGWSYSVATLDTFLLRLFDKYAELLKRRFSEDFQEVCMFSTLGRQLLTPSSRLSLPTTICPWLSIHLKNMRRSSTSAGFRKKRAPRSSRESKNPYRTLHV